MLSAKGLNKIRSIFKEEIIKALTVQVKMERYNKDKGMKVITEESIFMPEAAVGTLQYPDSV